MVVLRAEITKRCPQTRHKWKELPSTIEGTQQKCDNEQLPFFIII